VKKKKNSRVKIVKLLMSFLFVFFGK